MYDELMKISTEGKVENGKHDIKSYLRNNSDWFHLPKEMKIKLRKWEINVRKYKTEARKKYLRKRNKISVSQTNAEFCS